MTVSSDLVVTGEADGSESRPVDWSARLALAVFGVVVAAALVLYVHVGREYWFFQDDWLFVLGFDGGDAGDLFGRVNEHWATIPIVMFRVLWNIFGLDYRPYQFVLIVLHLTTAVLLRIVMRRARVGPWIATAVASMFALLAGSAWNNIMWAFQVTLVGSMVCGLAHLLSADHDGGFDVRDAIGLGFGIVGLMCSGVGITMTVVVGLAVLMRRGWRLAALHTAPLAAAFVIWYAFTGDDKRRERAGVGTTASFVYEGYSHAFERIGRLPGTAILFALVLAVGLVLAWASLPLGELRRLAAMPAALLLGAFFFMVTTGVGRAETYGVEYATRSRFVHVIVALTAPALAVAADAIASRWRLLTVPLCVLFLLGVFANIEDLWPARNAYGRPGLVLGAPSVPLFDDVPADVHPFLDRPGERWITVGWLREAIASGKIDPLDQVSPRVEAELTRRLALQRMRSGAVEGTCRPFVHEIRRLQQGDAITFRGAVLFRVLSEGGGESDLTGAVARPTIRLRALAGPITLEIGPYPGVETVECD